MRTWRWVEPGENNEPVYQTMTDADILREYFPYWKQQMERVCLQDLISEQNCIDDFVVVHWAEQVAPTPPESGK